MLRRQIEAETSHAASTEHSYICLQRNIKGAPEEIFRFYSTQLIQRTPVEKAGGTYWIWLPSRSQQAPISGPATDRLRKS